MRGRAYSQDLRERIVQAVGQGMSQHEVAQRFSVSVASVERYVRLDREGRSLAPAPRPGRFATVVPPGQHEALRAQVQEHADLTLVEHVALWSQQHGSVSATTLARRFRALGLTRKKDAARR